MSASTLKANSTADVCLFINIKQNPGTSAGGDPDTSLIDGIINDPELIDPTNKEEEETVEIVGACKLMDGFFLGDAICAEVLYYSS